VDPPCSNGKQKYKIYRGVKFVGEIDAKDYKSALADAKLQHGKSVTVEEFDKDEED